MEKLFWFLNVFNPTDAMGPFLRPLIACLILYNFDIFLLFFRYFFERVRNRPFPGLSEENSHAALVVLPTMLRRREDLEGLKRSMLATAENAYPGPLTVVASIDGWMTHPQLYHELESWIRHQPQRPNTLFFVTGIRNRAGKGMAIDAAIRYVEHLVEAGTLAKFPKVFFNMDADSAPGPKAFERMVFQLTKKHWITGERPMIVASNVKIAPSHYWRGWRGFFTLRGWISLNVAREYTTSISLGKHNSKLIPVTVASGALYCTWSDIPKTAPQYAAFMQKLRWRDIGRWWMGHAPPRFANSACAPLPEALTGEGDDTWMTWFACVSTWDGDRISHEFPRTPLHALARMIPFYFIRPLAYDPMAQVFTATPTTVKALFKQRIRWNGSGIVKMQSWCLAFNFFWGIGLTHIVNMSLLLVVHTLWILNFCLLPFTGFTGHLWLATVLLGEISCTFLRIQCMIVATLHENGDWRIEAPKFLTLPFASFYHTIFNMLPTIVAFWREIFGFGSNTQFAPTRTLIRANSSRIALSYRIGRAGRLSVRALRRGDVPLGTFWFGWKETPFTSNGYSSWDHE